jgi:putative DNA primase/helicase
MPAVTMQERLKGIAAGSGKVDLANEMLTIITPDLLPLDEPKPNLATPEGQKWLEPFLEDVELLVLDNLATLAPSGDEDKSKDWRPVQEWLLKLRRRGITVLLVHHAGKSGNQRGTSGREDVLDTVIALPHPEDYSPEQGARFEVHLEKARGICGDGARPFEAMLEIVEGAYVWSTSEIGKNPKRDKVLELRSSGKSLRHIAKETGISKSTVSRLAKAQ